MEIRILVRFLEGAYEEVREVNNSTMGEIAAVLEGCSWGRGPFGKLGDPARFHAELQYEFPSSKEHAIAALLEELQKEGKIISWEKI